MYLEHLFQDKGLLNTANSISRNLVPCISPHHRLPRYALKWPTELYFQWCLPASCWSSFHTDFVIKQKFWSLIMRAGLLFKTIEKPALVNSTSHSAWTCSVHPGPSSQAKCYPILSHCSSSFHQFGILEVWVVSPQDTSVLVNMTLFGNKVFAEITKL